MFWAILVIVRLNLGNRRQQLRISGLDCRYLIIDPGGLIGKLERNMFTRQLQLGVCVAILHNKTVQLKVPGSLPLHVVKEIVVRLDFHLPLVTPSILLGGNCKECTATILLATVRLESRCMDSPTSNLINL